MSYNDICRFSSIPLSLNKSVFFLCVKKVQLLVELKEKIYFYVYIYDITKLSLDNPKIALNAIFLLWN